MVVKLKMGRRSVLEATLSQTRTGLYSNQFLPFFDDTGGSLRLGKSAGFPHGPDAPS